MNKYFCAKKLNTVYKFLVDCKIQSIFFENNLKYVGNSFMKKISLNHFIANKLFIWHEKEAYNLIRLDIRINFSFDKYGCS